ncbi:hypothetical protein VP01_773g11 [Puccinia sorghi]|uniref:DDE Tnp4 domain-containing protein n=1 Tax=Puccinia sorghi TaxID=27349 RepID=A0A0L6UDJ8_9BASI|nr:hypothetical protein VP01_773g11 [Puccinia sorghi]
MTMLLQTLISSFFLVLFLVILSIFNTVFDPKPPCLLEKLQCTPTTSANGLAIGMLASFFRISEGAVILYCHCVVEEILALEISVAESTSGIAKTTGFKNCVGFVESTLIPLAEKPLIDATPGKCHMGWLPLFSHVTCLWENCDLNLQSDHFFSPGQYLIADSDFPTKTTLIPAFKEVSSRAYSLNKEELTLEESMMWLTQWIGACVVLQNFLLNDESPLIVCNSDSIDLLAPLDNYIFFIQSNQKKKKTR